MKRRVAMTPTEQAISEQQAASRIEHDDHGQAPPMRTAPIHDFFRNLSALDLPPAPARGASLEAWYHALADVLETRLQVVDVTAGCDDVTEDEVVFDGSGWRARVWFDGSALRRACTRAQLDVVERVAEVKKIKKALAMRTLSLIPAYGRDYSARAIIELDLKSGKDFQIADVSSKYNGSYVNLEQLFESADEKYTHVKVRYAKQRKACIIELESLRTEGKL